MKILFIVNENPDSGIRVYADIIAKKLGKEKGISIFVDEKLDEKYDLVHVHSCRPENLARLKIHQPYTPVVTSTHMTSGEVQGLVPDMVLSMIDLGLSTFYASCERVFVTSPHIMNELEKNPALSHKLVLLPYPVDPKRIKKSTQGEISAFKKKFSIDSKKKTVLCVASIQYRKGVFDFIEAAKKLSEYNFVWVGKIPELPYLKRKDEIHSIVENNPIPNLFFTGPLYGDELSAAYNSCDLFWLPSFSETFGLVIVEAALAGKNILIRNIPVSQMFKNFVDTYSQEPEKKIVEILENSKKFSSKRIIAKTEIKKLSLEKHCGRLVEEYKKVLEKKK